jgi:hypothetical protein
LWITCLLCLGCEDLGQPFRYCSCAIQVLPKCGMNASEDLEMVREAPMKASTGIMVPPCPFCAQKTQLVPTTAAPYR